MNFAISDLKIALSRKIFKDLYKMFTGTQSERLLNSTIRMILFWNTWTFCTRLFAAVSHARIPY